MSRAGSRILASLRAPAPMRAARRQRLPGNVPESVDVKAIRTRLGLSQSVFAHRFGFTPAAVRDWEQHRRQPEQAARVLLLVIAHDPEAVERALAAGQPTERRRAAGGSLG